MNLDLFVHPFARQDVRTNSSVFSIFLLEVTKEIEEVQLLRKSTFGSGGPKNRPEMRLFRCFDKKIIYLHALFGPNGFTGWFYNSTCISSFVH